MLKRRDQANTLVEQAMAAMELRYEIFTTIIQCSCTICIITESLSIRRAKLIMTGWDDVKVKEV